jgi:Mrp family chromosome partitioning ATPase
MLGVNRKPEVNAERKILPLEAAGGVKVMSIGFFVEENSAGRLARPDAAQGDPAVPRGRRLGRARVPAARPAAGDRATSR